MNLSRYRCPQCQGSNWRADSTRWHCQACGRDYSCVNGIPRLYLEGTLPQRDRELRDTFYNGFPGTYYQHVMPFLSLPARPARAYWKGWLTYVLIVASLLGLVASLINLWFAPGPGHSIAVRLAVPLLAVAVCSFLLKHPYLFYLLILAVPVKVSLQMRRFRPAQTFQEIHADVLRGFQDRKERLQVLDLATGTCNSLYRHGWMTLDADYTGLDVSETMLLQGQKFMSDQHVPIELVLADAAHPPFQSETFDIVLNYGALNGLTDARHALEEMARITRKGGLILFLDEQLYEGATFVERLYFRNVLSSHNVIHRCPVELIPDSLKSVRVHQVYAFYYVCTGYKA